MLCFFFISIWAIFSPLAALIKNKDHLPMSSCGPCIPRFVLNDFPLIASSGLWNCSICWWFCVIRSVLMQLRLLMHSITLIITLVRFLDAMTEMCIQSCMRRHGRILWTIQLFLMALKSMFNRSSSNNYVMLDSRGFWI